MINEDQRIQNEKRHEEATLDNNDKFSAPLFLFPAYSHTRLLFVAGRCGAPVLIKSQSDNSRPPSVARAFLQSGHARPASSVGSYCPRAHSPPNGTSFEGAVSVRSVAGSAKPPSSIKSAASVKSSTSTANLSDVLSSIAGASQHAPLYAALARRVTDLGMLAVWRLRFQYIWSKYGQRLLTSRGRISQLQALLSVLSANELPSYRASVLLVARQLSARKFPGPERPPKERGRLILNTTPRLAFASKSSRVGPGHQLAQWRFQASMATELSDCFWKRRRRMECSGLTCGCRAHRFQIIVELSRIDPGVLERSRTLLGSDPGAATALVELWRKRVRMPSFMYEAERNLDSIPLSEDTHLTNFGPPDELPSSNEVTKLAKAPKTRSLMCNLAVDHLEDLERPQISIVAPGRPRGYIQPTPGGRPGPIYIRLFYNDTRHVDIFGKFFLSNHGFYIFASDGKIEHNLELREALKMKIPAGS
ncbi:hypothetical protein C8J57DRAFT_1213046 [Mycena rebaudengoi]|nr:hypothetical protein C8J57DRAFT_1213046 [Mycena rebaudengoi]